MPYISTRTNVKITEETEKLLKAELGKAIELIPGKTENWLMLDFEDNCRLYFKGSNEQKLAYIEVKLFGSASASAYDNLTAEITRIINSHLGISPDCVYVKYEEVSTWGWNGNNF